MSFPYHSKGPCSQYFCSWICFSRTLNYLVDDEFLALFCVVLNLGAYISCHCSVFVPVSLGGSLLCSAWYHFISVCYFNTLQNPIFSFLILVLIFKYDPDTVHLHGEELLSVQKS
ncbi:uncharacterized protein A4U43_C08F770 [Asparagus officinalis]|nr:uncharacterized protein A4U43_C08F770 [Asparagus officinalis]